MGPMNRTRPDITSRGRVAWSLAAAGVVLALALGACGDAMESPFGITDAPDDAAGDATSTETTLAATADTTAPGDTTASGDSGEGATDGNGGGDTGDDPSAPLQGLAVEVIATGLHQPTVVTAPAGDLRLFVVERQGVIRVVDEAGRLLEDAFLDLRDRVGANGIEQGLLGLAFHPEYSSNGRFFVYYTDAGGRRQLSEFALSDDPNRGDGDSEIVLIELEQPPDSTDIRHYAGALTFGPEGHLYVSLGDGADARNQGQNPDTMFGTIVRLDVDAGDPYAIPADNPFVDGGGAAEVWAYGLRNPWRFAIDAQERLMYIADVGQQRWEEVNVVGLDEGAGSNFGWFTTEGAHCFSPSECDMTGLVLPVLEYNHDEGCSITGGYVYRGEAIPELDGHYFYADWCGLWVRSFRYENGTVTEEQDWSDDLTEAGQVNTFGLDGAGEMYIANFEGTVMRIVPVR